MTAASLAFDLPARLSAKADPRLLDGDDRHLVVIGESLERSLADLVARRDAQLRAPGGPGQQAMDRDAEIHRLEREIRTLRRFGLDVCLGRMVRSDDPDPVYIGRVGMKDADGRRILIDWRSRAAEPFFGATHANPMGLASRRRYRWAGGRVVDFWDEVFDDSARRGHAALDDQSAFIASLGGSRSARMRDVLGTIQADQDAVIRSGSRGALVVDGGPGTGKTVVALHRTAYLLYSDRRLSRGHHGGVLFVGPSPAYLAYVDDVLPNLGEEGVQSCTLRDLVPEGRTAIPEADPAVARLKADTRMAEVVEAAVRHHERPPQEELTVSTPWAEVSVSAADWAAAFDAAEPGMPHDDAREVVWAELLTHLVRGYDEDSADDVRRALNDDEELRAVFSRAWPLLDPTGVVADLLTVPSYLRSCALWLQPEEVAALQRADGRRWTTADIPLLDAARHRIGDPREARRARRRDAVLAEERDRRSRVIDDLIAADDDGVGLVTMLRGADAQNSLDDEAALPSREPDLLAGPFAHIVVDEAQELTDAEWQMLLRRCPSRSFTVVGDRAQARSGFDGSWEDRLGGVGLDRVAVASLSINYRTPDEVMAVAAPLVRSAVPDANVPTSVRRGGLPVRRGRVDELDGILDEWLAESTDGVACVIDFGAGSDAGDAGADLPAGAGSRVRRLTPVEAKGLEFDLAVLVDAPTPDGVAIDLARHSGGRSPAVAAAVDGYVAMTRTTRQLVLLDRTGAETATHA